MKRRRFLGSVAAGLAGLAGCGGDAASSADIEPAAAGQYGDRSVRLDGSYVFLLTYYPEYARTLGWLPEGTTRGRILDARAGPTRFASAESVESYFEGFTRNAAGWLAYADARGSFDAGAVADRMATDAGYEAVQGGRRYATDHAAVALADDRIVWAQVSGGDPVDGLATVLSTYRGERQSYAAAEADLGLLVGALDSGHRIDVAPANAARFGASQYGRQFVFGPEMARPEEVVVFDDPPADARSRVEEGSVVLDDYEGTSLQRVVVEGRTARAVYAPIPNTDV